MAAADSAATAYYNPTAMTLLDRPQALGGIIGISGETRFDSNSKTTASGGDGGNQSGNAVAPAGPFFVYPVTEEWAVGFSVTAPIVGALEPRDTWAGRYVITKLKLATYRFGPSVAYRVNDWLSLGATVGVNYSKLGFRVKIPSPIGASDGKLRISDADQWVVNWGLSALIEPCEGTRLGIAWNSEIDNDDLDGDITLRGAAVGFADDVEVKLTLPQYAAVSLRQEVTDDLVLFADVAWADLSEFSSLIIDIGGPVAINAATHFHDTVGYGIAAEYAPSPEWTVSGGVSYASSPVSQSNRNAALPFDRQIRYGTGVRYRWNEDVTFALSYEYLDLGRSKLTNTVAGESLSGKYSTDKVQFLALTVSKGF
jgi:long-chain fatty acid transport protein